MNGFKDIFNKWIEAVKIKNPKKALVIYLSLIATAVLFIISLLSGSQENDSVLNPGYYIGVFIKLIGVLLLIVGCSAIFRRFQNKQIGISPARQVSIVETIRLTPKQTLHLVKLGDQKLLIGATDQNISLISQVTIPGENYDQIQANDVSSSNFASYLRNIDAINETSPR